MNSQCPNNSSHSNRKGHSQRDSGATTDENWEKILAFAEKSYNKSIEIIKISYKPTLILLGLLIFIEYICIRNEFKSGPSHYLSLTATHLYDFFKACGTLFANVCERVARFINLGQLFEAIWSIFKPLWEITTSWTGMFTGYATYALDAVCEYYVHIGTFMVISIIAGISCICYRKFLVKRQVRTHTA